jgi:hypothetical protein
MARIEGLRGQRGTGQVFDDLQLPLRVNAQRTFGRLCARWSRNLPQWRMPPLVGRARWLTLHPPDSAWGRRMLAKRGGRAVQRRYRLEGRTGRLHPARYAAVVSASMRRWRKRKRQDEERRARLGLPPKLRAAHPPLEGEQAPAPFRAPLPPDAVRFPTVARSSVTRMMRKSRSGFTNMDGI